MPRVPDELLESVVFLYRDERAAKIGEQVGATGFFVGIRSEALQRRYTYLITNEHVARRDLVVRGNTDDGIDFLTVAASDWEPHPDGDDVAAAWIEVPDHWHTKYLIWEDLFPTPERMGADDLNVGIGDDTVMVGRFIGHEGESNQPVARFGNIALMPGEPILDGRDLRVEAYLTEMRSLPGYSGSPVFVYIGPASYRGNKKMMPFYSETIGLLGIDTGHKQESASIYIKGTRTKIGEPWEVRQNSGVAIVAPAEKITDVLREGRFVAQRKSSDEEWVNKHGGEMASSDEADEPGEFENFEDLTRKLVDTPKPKTETKD